MTIATFKEAVASGAHMRAGAILIENLDISEEERPGVIPDLNFRIHILLASIKEPKEIGRAMLFAVGRPALTAIFDEHAGIIFNALIACAQHGEDFGIDGIMRGAQSRGEPWENQVLKALPHAAQTSWYAVRWRDFSGLEALARNVRGHEVRERAAAKGLVQLYENIKGNDTLLARARRIFAEIPAAVEVLDPRPKQSLIGKTSTRMRTAWRSMGTRHAPWRPGPRPLRIHGRDRAA